jgi:hypothetical protein
MMRAPQRLPMRGGASAASLRGGASAGSSVGEKRKMQCIDFKEAKELRTADDDAAKGTDDVPEPVAAAKKVQERLRASMVEKEREKCVCECCVCERVCGARAEASGSVHARSSPAHQNVLHLY